MPDRILVTGASGVLGGVLLRRFKARGAVGVSRSGKNASRILDLSQEKAVRAFFDKEHFDWMIHAAAYSDVDGCEREPAAAYASNALSTKFLAEICSTRNIPLIYISTDYVFDGRKRAPYETDDPTCPINIYGMTKLAGEHFASACRGRTAIVRTSWLFGPDNPRNFVNVLVHRLKNETAVRVLDDQIGAPTSVYDLAEALERVGGYLQSSKRGSGNHPEIFHFCNAGQATRFSMVQEMVKIMGFNKRVRIEKADRSQIEGRLALRPASSVMSCRHFEKVFGMKIRPWQESLKQYLAEGKD